MRHGPIAFPAGTFDDVDGDALTLSATLADGSALPSWLSFDAETQTFTGTPPQDFNGSFDIRVSASDGQEVTTTDFSLIIDPVNDAPILISAIESQNSDEDAAWSYTIPESTFADVDGDILTLSATLADGSALPSWLSFDANTQTFSGTPSQDFNGSFDLRVTASDGDDTVSTNFTLTIDPVNDTPIVITPVANQSSDEDTAWAYSIPAGTFTDVDGDALTLSASLADGSALPAWLSFDANTQTFSGTPPQDFNGSFDLRVTASDGLESIATDFTLTIDALNDVPVITNAIPDQNITEGQVWTYIIPENIFTDVDGDALTFTAALDDGSPLPSWIFFDPSTKILFGFPPPNITDPVNIAITAFDGIASISASFTLNIEPANNAPIIASPIADQNMQEDQFWSFIVPPNTFSDPDGDMLTINASLADGSPLPPWLIFDSNTKVFFAIPPKSYTGTLNLRLTASDGMTSTPMFFSLIINSVNDAPFILTPITNQTISEDQPWSFTIPENTFEDNDGDALTLSATLADGSSLPSWLSFDAETQTFTGTPPQDFNGTLELKVTAFDGTTTISANFTLTIDQVNDIPIVVTSIESQNSDEDAAWAYTIPAGTFDDVDGDALTLSATLADGSDLPAWLNFDANTQTFAGTPPQDFNGVFDIRVTASDGLETVATDFTLTIDPVNDAPVVVMPIDDTIIAAGTLTISEPLGIFFDDLDGDELTLSVTLADGSPLPSWSSFDPETQILSATPPEDATGEYNLRLTASDGIASTSINFTVNIIDNQAPIISSPILNQTIAEDTAWSYTIPADTFADADGDILTLSATLADGSPLPAWLSFDANTQTFSGTPPQHFNGAFNIWVIASDALDEIGSGFTLLIDPVNDVPIAIIPISDINIADGDTWNSFPLDIYFDDVDNDDLIFTATLADGSPLPFWSSFDPVTQILSAIPPLGTSGEFNILIIASDGIASTSSAFKITIEAPAQGDYGEINLNNFAGILGTDGDDIIEGTALSDQIIGLAGNDIMAGGFGNDIYYYKKGDGHDIIDDFFDKSRLVLTDINPDEISLSRGNEVDDLLVEIIPTGETITILRGLFFSLGSSSGQEIEFANGTIWTIEDFTSNISSITGTNGNDELVGGSLDDHIIGLEGDDMLNGHTGNDTYYYKKGDGNDIIDDIYGINKLVLEDINPEDVQVSPANQGDDAQLKIISTGETITLVDENKHSKYYHIEFADGTIWESADILDNTIIRGTDGDDNLAGYFGVQQNIIDGGAGDDILTGGFHTPDIFVFAKGYDQDVIRDFTSLDIIDLRGYGISSFEEAISYASDQQIGTFSNQIIFDFGEGDQLTVTNNVNISGIEIANLSEDNFIFS